MTMTDVLERVRKRTTADTCNQVVIRLPQELVNRLDRQAARETPDETAKPNRSIIVRRALGVELDKCERKARSRRIRPTEGINIHDRPSIKN